MKEPKMMTGVSSTGEKFTIAIHTDRHEEPASYLEEVAGLLPAIFINSEGESLVEKANNGYAQTAGSPVHWNINTKAKIVDGKYTYPGDPDLGPVMTIYRDDTPEYVHIYHYGMVAVYDGKEWHTARMD